ncbi:MAG: hypothetical protein J5845_01325 [Lachnospiraceae bacterium]|nr:hypothetical protein [Lachnospiraceae bacterium]
MNERRNRSEVNIFIIVLILIGLAAAGVFIAMQLKHSKYSKGTYDGNTYINEWAGVKVTLPSDYKIDHEKNTGPQTSRYYTNPGGSEIFGICSISGESSVDRGLDTIRSTVISGFASTAYGYNLTTNDYKEVTIAGRKYKCLPMQVDSGDVSMYINFYACRINKNGVMLFCIAGMSGDDVSRMLNYISKR